MPRLPADCLRSIDPGPSVAAMFIIFARDFAVGLEARITGVPEAEWPRLFMDYLSRSKIAIMVFNLAPWLALLIVG